MINKKIFNHYSRLKKSEFLSLNKLEKKQIVLAKTLIEFAYKNSIFYKSYFKKNNFHPNDFTSLKDLKKIPILEKKHLIEFNKSIHTGMDKKKLIFSETSGSTGESLGFYRTKEWDAATRSAIFRGYSWHGIKPWDRNGYFWGYNISKPFKVKFLDFFLNRFRVFSYKKNEIKKFIKKLESSVFIEGYSSMIYEVAKIINRKKNKINYDLKMVKGTSEKIFDSYQPEIKKAFGRKMISEYGAAETGIIAFECSNEKMHIVMENVIVEEEKNEILVTNLWSKSFPIIRYRLGDYVKLSSQYNCKCGMKHKIIEEVIGRIGQLIIGKKIQYPSLVLYYIFKNLAIDKNLEYKYQGFQNKVGEIIFFIEQRISESEKKIIVKESRKYFNNDMDVIIKQNKSPRKYEGKLKDFISLL